MKIQSNPDLHLTYCLNIHPGESLEEIVAAIEGPATQVKHKVSPDADFGLGIRLGTGPANELTDHAIKDLKDLLVANEMYVFTINGFPYGEFHGTRVKENVYAPDWRTDARRTYTEKLIHILSELLPEGVYGSISTVPVSYGPWIESDNDLDSALKQLVGIVGSCLRCEEMTGKHIAIALEPEPDCYVQSISGLMSFFNEHLMRKGVDLLSKESGMSPVDSEAAIRRYLGVCFDTCHAAVQFEDPCLALQRLAAEGIDVPKVQVSSAIKTTVSDAARAQLSSFIDPVYFHQTRTRRSDGDVAKHADLDAELLESLEDGLELRTHFHVPLWFEAQDGLEGTVDELSDDFFALIRSGITGHVEAETYTFDVLPENLRDMDVADSLARELEWLKGRIMS